MKQLVRIIKEHVCDLHEAQGFDADNRPFCLPLHPDVITHKNKRLAHCRKITLCSALSLAYECEAVEQEQVIIDLVTDWYAEQEQIIGPVDVEIYGKRYHTSDLKKAGAQLPEEIVEGDTTYGWFPEYPDIEEWFASHVYITIHDPENYGA